MSRFVRPAVVALIADAYRHAESPIARALLESRHREFFPAECAAALAEVRAEAEAELILLEAGREFAGDREAARARALLELSDAELMELFAAGLLDVDEDDVE